MDVVRDFDSRVSCDNQLPTEVMVLEVQNADRGCTTRRWDHCVPLARNRSEFTTHLYQFNEFLHHLSGLVLQDCRSAAQNLRSILENTMIVASAPRSCFLK